jgi:cytochrome c biogenesis protein
MYHSWWFQFLLLLLAANVVVCSLERIPATLKIVFAENPRVNLSPLMRLPEKEEFRLDLPSKEAERICLTYVSRKFGFSQTKQTDQGYGIYGERGRWTRLGVYAVHLSVMVLLLGGFIGSRFGFEGFVNIPEGETVNRIRLRNSDEAKQLEFSIRCDDFDVQFYETGAPKEYRSRLTILEDGNPVLQKDILVNDPLRYKGINVFQSSYGALSLRAVTLKFKSAATGMMYPVPATIGESIVVPEAGGEFVIRDYRNAFPFRGRNIGEVLLGTLTPKNGTPSEIILPLRFPEFDRMRNGDWVISATDPQYVYYTGLQVTKDPSVWVVYTGFITMIIGFYIAFFMSHQRLFIEVIEEGDQSRILVSGTANKNTLGMRRKVKRIAEKLEGMGR